MVDFGSDILDTEVPEIEPLDVDISSEPQHELTMALTSGSVKSSSPVVFDFSLQSRVEVILNAIINDLVYGEHPKSRVEQILLYILGEVNELPKPHSRVEELLIDLALELESTDISPKSRVEQILLVLLNQPYEFPITHSRVEELLVQLQKHVSKVTGPLPLTITTDGTALLDYRIYGNTENGESVGERTENLIDANLSKQTIEIKPSTPYAISKYVNLSARDLRFSIYDENDNLLWDDYLGKWWGENIKVYDNAKYFKITIPNSLLNAVSLVEGQRPNELPTYKPYPENYIPYGYKLPMVMTNGTATTTTPIYIGPDPLAEDEYVDFGEQKIYRMEGGTLTPTDPPVPIPALPTIEGKTIIDYNPSTTPAVEPEKMYVKYNKS